MRILLLLVLPVLLSGCIAQTAVDIATLPVKAARTGVGAVSAGVDAVTTSQAETDQKRGRAIREEEERLGRIARRCARDPERAECAELREADAPR